MAVICIDAGTTMIKAVGYDDDGAEQVVVREATVVTRPAPAWAEQDMELVWDAVVACVRSVGQQLGSSVDYVALTAQGDGSWLVDRDGAPTGPAILWNDGRAAGIVDGWTRAGVLDRAFLTNGSLTSCGMPNAILSWLRLNDPDRLARSAMSLTCGGWIFSQLTGEFAIDESDASAPFMDIRARQYSADLLSLYDLEWAERLLPGVRGDNRRVAELTSGAAAAMGLTAGTPVVMSSYDIASTAIGVGAVEVGQACTILGTTLCTEIVTDTVSLGDEAAGCTVALGIPGKYLRAFPTLSGGEVVQWACRLMGLADPVELGELATRCPPGADGLLFLPYLSPAGERAPFLNPLASGSLLGMSVEHGPEHVARAVLEGLTLVIRDCLTASRAQPTELRVSGGGAASPVWLQMIADVTGVQVSRTTDTETGARGAYLIGMVATGGATCVEEITPRYIKVRDTFSPDVIRSQAYAEMFVDFCSLRGSASATWPRLTDMRARTPAAGLGTSISPSNLSEQPGSDALIGQRAAAAARRNPARRSS